MLETGGSARADHAGRGGRGRGRRVMVMMVMVVMRMAVRSGARVRMVMVVAAHHARAVHAGMQRTVAGPVRHRGQRGHR